MYGLWHTFLSEGLPYGKETIGCPIGNYIPEWNDLVYHQDFKSAYERLKKQIIFRNLLAESVQHHVKTHVL